MVVAHKAVDLVSQRILQSTKVDRSALGHKSGLPMQRLPLIDGQDSFRFQAGAEGQISKEKDFWRTVNSEALGGKNASWFRKAWGAVIYPFVLMWKSLLWMTGQRAGFKPAEPLLKESREALEAAVRATHKELPKALQQPLELDGLHKSRLIKLNRSLTGLRDLTGAKTTREAGEALERFLSANGKNNGQSCAYISAAHAEALKTGYPVKRYKVQESDVVLTDPVTDETGRTFQTIIFESQQGTDTVEALHKELVDEFRIDPKTGVNEFPSMDLVPLLLNRPGAQALIFKLAGKNGHATMAANIRGKLFHIDNASNKSGVVKPWKAFEAEQIEPDARYWVGLLKDPVHPAIANGPTLKD